jgi:heme-degrading monooxygenase HmoA
MSTVVEVVLMRAKPHVTKTQVLEAAVGAKNDMDALPGLISRELLYNDEDGQWVDVVYWESMEHAKQAIEIANQKPNILRLFSLLDDSSVQLMHLHPIKL